MVLNQRLTQSDRGARCRAHARLLRELWPVTQMERLSEPEACCWKSSASFSVTHWMTSLRLCETTISVCLCTTCRGVVISNQRRNLKPNISETALFVQGFWRSDPPPRPLRAESVPIIPLAPSTLCPRPSPKGSGDPPPPPPNL